MFPIANCIHNWRIRKRFTKLSKTSYPINWKWTVPQRYSHLFYNSSINVDNIFFPLKAVEKSINYKGFLEGIPAFLGYFFDVPFAFVKEMNARCASPIENLYTSSTFPPRRKIADFAAATSFSHSPDL